MTGATKQNDKEMVAGFSQGLGSPRLQQNTLDSHLSFNAQFKGPPP